MGSHRITLIPGDGVGPELVEAARRAVEATGVRIEWDTQEAGTDVQAREGTPVPDRVLASIRSNGVALKGPLTALSGELRSPNVELRLSLDLYAGIRPCRSFPGVRSRYEGVDLVVIRENTEDSYTGIEFEQRGVRDRRAARVHRTGHREPDPRGLRALDQGDSVGASRRIVAFAFDHARAHGRREVTAGHKANIMKLSDGVFLETARSVAAEHPEVVVRGPDHRQPHGAAGAAPGGPRRPGPAEPVRGHRLGPMRRVGRRARPGPGREHRGRVRRVRGPGWERPCGDGPANPMAPMLSGAMMLRHLGEGEAGDRLEAAVGAVIAEGRSVTRDLRPDRDDAAAVGPADVAEAVTARLWA